MVYDIDHAYIYSHLVIVPNLQCCQLGINKGRGHTYMQSIEAPIHFCMDIPKLM
jgi:hypothetical protein